MTQPTLEQELEACTQRCKTMNAPLEERLSVMADDVRRLAPGFAEVVDRMVARLKNGGAGAAAPAVGDVMPDFVLPDDSGKLTSLGSLLASGKVVIAFHRGHWCPYCQINLETLANIEPEVRAAGGQLVVITPETQKFTKQFKSETGAAFPVLTDIDCGYALELNLAILINEEKRTAMTLSGWDISPYNANNNWILPIPATFIVGQDGIVTGRFVDPDYRKRMGIDDLLAALRL
jgi:peroxiredoxin